MLQEFYVNMTRKIEDPLAPDVVVGSLDEFRRFPLVPTDYPLIVAGAEVGLRYGISYWDGAIIAAAGRLGATVLFSEDLSNGQRYGTVQVVNPFRALGPDSVHENNSGSYGEA